MPSRVLLSLPLCPSPTHFHQLHPLGLTLVHLSPSLRWHPLFKPLRCLAPAKLRLSLRFSPISVTHLIPRLLRREGSFFIYPAYFSLFPLRPLYMAVLLWPSPWRTPALASVSLPRGGFSLFHSRNGVTRILPFPIHPVRFSSPSRLLPSVLALRFFQRGASFHPSRSSSRHRCSL